MNYHAFGLKWEKDSRMRFYVNHGCVIISSELDQSNGRDL